MVRCFTFDTCGLCGVKLLELGQLVFKFFVFFDQFQFLEFKFPSVGFLVFGMAFVAVSLVVASVGLMAFRADHRVTFL